MNMNKSYLHVSIADRLGVAADTVPPVSKKKAVSMKPSTPRTVAVVSTTATPAVPVPQETETPASVECPVDQAFLKGEDPSESFRQSEVDHRNNSEAAASVESEYSEEGKTFAELLQDDEKSRQDQKARVGAIVRDLIGVRRDPSRDGWNVWNTHKEYVQKHADQLTIGQAHLLGTQLERTLFALRISARKARESKEKELSTLARSVAEAISKADSLWAFRQAKKAAYHKLKNTKEISLRVFYQVVKPALVAKEQALKASFLQRIAA